MTTDISVVRGGWDPTLQQEIVDEYEYDGGNSSSRLFERSRIKALAGTSSFSSFFPSPFSFTSSWFIHLIKCLVNGWLVSRQAIQLWKRVNVWEILLNSDGNRRFFFVEDVNFKYSISMLFTKENELKNSSFFIFEANL